MKYAVKHIRVPIMEPDPEIFDGEGCGKQSEYSMIYFLFPLCKELLNKKRYHVT